MSSPEFLRLDDLLEIHRDQIERYGGVLGARDIGLLQSAIAQPCATFAGNYLHADLFEMAAAYLFHIARNHPFIDGINASVRSPRSCSLSSMVWS